MLRLVSKAVLTAAWVLVWSAAGFCAAKALGAEPRHGVAAFAAVGLVWAASRWTRRGAAPVTAAVPAPTSPDFRRETVGLEMPVDDMIDRWRDGVPARVGTPVLVGARPPCRSLTQAETAEAARQKLLWVHRRIRRPIVQDLNPRLPVGRPVRIHGVGPAAVIVGAGAAPSKCKVRWQNGVEEEVDERDLVSASPLEGETWTQRKCRPCGIVFGFGAVRFMKPTEATVKRAWCGCLTPGGTP